MATRAIRLRRAWLARTEESRFHLTQGTSRRPAGHQLKGPQVNRTGLSYPYPVYTANLDTSYSYDTEGKMKSVSYPNAGPAYTYSFDSMSRPSG